MHIRVFDVPPALLQTNPDVMDALHIPPKSFYFSADNGDGMVYNLTWASNLPLMRRLQSGVDGVRVLVYNGDTDPSVTTLIAQNWTTALNFPVLEAWRQWTFDNVSGVVGGEIVRWKNGFDFVTIRGSGHMVPRFKPYSAYLMMKRWINDETWPGLAPQSPSSPSKSLLFPNSWDVPTSQPEPVVVAEA